MRVTKARRLCDMMESISKYLFVSPLFFFSLCLSSLDLEEMEKIPAFRKRCIIPVLGLIENSLYENSLVHNILCMLLQLLNACPKLADILLDHGLLYVLFNTLSTLNGMENGYGCQKKRSIHLNTSTGSWVFVPSL